MSPAVPSRHKPGPGGIMACSWVCIAQYSVYWHRHQDNGRHAVLAQAQVICALGRYLHFLLISQLTPQFAPGYWLDPS